MSLLGGYRVTQVHSATETWQQRCDRRGNDVADSMADRGRTIHDISSHAKKELKRIESNVKQYHRWTAYAAAAQHNGQMKPDHDIREGPRPRKAKTPKTEPKAYQKKRQGH